MHKPYLLAGFLLVSLASFAQDTTWRITRVNKDMTFSLPSNQEKIDTSTRVQLTRMDLRVFKATTENTLFVLTVTRQGADINATDPESVKEAYNGTEKALKKSKNLAGYNTMSSDTMVDKIAGRKVIFYTGNDSLDIRLKAYVFLINDHLYLLLVYKQGMDEAYKAESNRVLRSIHFTATEISEQQFSSKLDSRGYRFGYLIGELIASIVTIVAVVVVVVLIVRRSSRKQEY